ncbi:MAG: diguanylate cyclase (GGDEF)-like protein [Kiritimatiellia bacterium]|jgi:diguanylate cyclase (GGDEF)-like protein
MSSPVPDSDLLLDVIDAANHGIIAYRVVRDSQRRVAGFRTKLTNRTARQVLGTNEPIAAVLTNLLPDRATDDLFHSYAQIATAGGTVDFIKTFEDSTGAVEASWQIEACALSDGLLVTLRDVTPMARRLREHADERAFLRVVSSHSSDLVSLHDNSGFCVAASDAAQQLLDIEAQQLIGSHLTERLTGHQALTRGSRLRVPSRSRVQTKGTPERWLDVSLTAEKDLVVAVLRDVTELHLLQRRIEQLSPEDSLTGLASRKVFIEQLVNELHRRKRYGRPLCVVAIRAEGLSAIEDEHGAETRLRAMKLLADVTKNVLRNVDLAGRWTNDVFLLLLPETPPQGALRAIERLSESLREQAVHSTSPPLFLTVNAGITDADWADDHTSILRRVGAALNAARKKASGTVITAKRRKAA